MGRNLTYIIPLVVLSLLGGGVQAWSSRHTPSGSGAAAVARAPEGKPEPLRLSPEEVARGLASAAASDVSARELRRAQRWVQAQRERLRQLQERSRADALALEHSQADARLLEQSREALERSRSERRRLRERLADRDRDVHLLRRQVALLEAVIQAWEEAAPAEQLRDTLQAGVSLAGPSPWEERARWLTLQGLYRQASEAFCRALSLNSADPILHYNLGLLSEEVLGEPGRALYHYERFLALVPEGPQASRIRQRAQRLVERN